LKCRLKITDQETLINIKTAMTVISKLLNFNQQFILRKYQIWLRPKSVFFQIRWKITHQNSFSITSIKTR